VAESIDRWNPRVRGESTQSERTDPVHTASRYRYQNQQMAPPRQTAPDPSAPTTTSIVPNAASAVTQATCTATRVGTAYTLP